MKARFFKRKKRVDHDFIYWSIGEDTESQLPEDRKYSDVPALSTSRTNANEASAHEKIKLISNSNSRKEAHEAGIRPTRVVHDELWPPASSLKSRSSTELATSTSFPRTDTSCEGEKDGRSIGFSSLIDARELVSVPDLDEFGVNNSNINSSSVRRRNFPLLRKKNKYRGGLLSNAIYNPMNGYEGDGMLTPSEVASLNLRTSRNWSKEPAAPYRWHQIHDDDDDTEQDGEEIGEGYDENGPADPLADDLCNPSRPVGCVSIAVTAGIAALWLL